MNRVPGERLDGIQGVTYPNRRLMSVTRNVLMHMFGRFRGVPGRLGGIIMARMNENCGAWVADLLEIGRNAGVGGACRWYRSVAGEVNQARGMQPPSRAAAGVTQAKVVERDNWFCVLAQRRQVVTDGKRAAKLHDRLRAGSYLHRSGTFARRRPLTGSAPPAGVVLCPGKSDGAANRSTNKGGM
jgi:hypothetical protein